MNSQSAREVVPLPDGSARIHYFRTDDDFNNWTVYVFGDTTEPTGDYNAGPVFLSGIDSYGAYFDIRLKSDARDLGFIIHNIAAASKDPGPDMHLDVAQFREAWIVSGDQAVYTVQPAPAQILEAGFARLEAFWIDRGTFAIRHQFFHSNWSYTLAHSADASLKITSQWLLEGSDGEIALMPYAAGLNHAQRAKYPRLARYAVLHLSNPADTTLPKLLLKGQIALAARNGNNEVRYLTGLQTAGVIDDLLDDPGSLGISFGKLIQIRLWAPTAKSVRLLLFEKQTDTVAAAAAAMAEENGVWCIEVEPSWRGKYYLFRVLVYVPKERRIIENLVTDPYSVDLALNGAKSRFTDLQNAETKPDGWDEHRPPDLAAKGDLSIYELHVRDFSANDDSVEEPYRGTYLAFANPLTRGMQHLAKLAEAGLRAIHLLPTFHFGSVDEDKSTWQSPGELSSYPSDSTEQQARVANIQNADAYNWGYDPVHYLAPAGAYAFDPNARVKEYREMVLALHRAGLRVIQDLVFNHTLAAGQAPFSVLDKAVPGYYYRLDADGNVQNTSCCPDTASEHRMMEKLMVDAIVHSAREYKIDAFRFDLMGFHFISNMQRIVRALADLTIENDGVDGSKIYLYGEGWEMGSTAWNALGKNATQRNLFGMGIGTFNDRVRDAIRGGNPFSEQRLQGFATGLFTGSSDYTESTRAREDQLALLLLQTDWIKIALAGNLRDFTFTDRNGHLAKASEVSYNGQPAGYAASPVETVNYCSVHDNQTLFDAVQLKAAASDLIALRARRHVLAMSLIAFSQGIPFFYAGDDLLRSKDMDENSYNSGDWFNRLDFSYRRNNWGIGLPLAAGNQESWPLMQPLLANSTLKPSANEIAYARDGFRELLTIRNSSRLFRMRSLEEVQVNLRFLNNGPAQLPGVIVMRLEANGKDYGPYRRVLVVFNARMEPASVEDPALQKLELHLHPVLASSSDQSVRESTYNPENGSVQVPALTTAVFVA